MFSIKNLEFNELAKGKSAANSYKVEDFESVDKDLAALTEENMIDLRSEIREKYGPEEKGIMILTYIVGRINTILKPHEYSVRLNNLILSFYENDNNPVAKYLGEKILECGESGKALRVLGDIADKEQDENKKWNYYERCVKADNQDYEVLIKLADHATEEGDRKTAMNHYRRALSRLIRYEAESDTKKGEIEVNISKVFDKLLKNGMSPFTYYLTFLSSLSEKDSALSVSLYNELLISLATGTDSGDGVNIDYRIDVCRKILMIDPTRENIREYLKEGLSKKYADAPRLKECLKKNDVTALGEDPIKALNDFEKNILYSTGNYVIQKATGRVGKIDSISGSQVTVRYSRTEEQKVKLEDAFEIFKPITYEHIKAIKKGVSPDRIRDKILSQGGIDWLVKTLLRSVLPGATTLKEMKNEIYPQIISESEWAQVNEKIKKNLKENPHVRTIPGSTDSYMWMDYESTADEKINYVFRKSISFYAKVGVLFGAVSSKDIDKESERFMEMVGYFEDKVSSITNTPVSERIASVIILDMLGDLGISVNYDESFESLYGTLSLQERRNLLSEFVNPDIKKSYIDHVIDFEEDPRVAEDELIYFFPAFVSPYIPEKLRELDRRIELRSKDDGESGYIRLLNRSLDNYRENVLPLLYFTIDRRPDSQSMKKAGITPLRLVKAELMALSYTSRISAQKKNFQTLRKDLIDEGRIVSEIKSAKNASEASEIVRLITHNEGLTNSERNKFKALSFELFPSLAENEDRNTAKSAPTVKAVSGFLCTSKSKDRKLMEVKDINERLMPEINAEINKARELGDLSENSEYIYAKEHKSELEARLAELNNDLNTVRVMTMQDVVPGLIGFGTDVVLKDNKNGNTIEYQFMGRWESDPEKNILDINAPFGQGLFNHAEGDVVKFVINGTEYDYTVLKVEAADFPS